MILLTVISYNNAPCDGLSASFDELGGTIGRADNNQLVLPDPERTISRVHARVVFRSGTYAIVDNGSNPISVNGVPLGAGREQALKVGDQVQVGGYALAVSEGNARQVVDPFADLFGDAPIGLASPPPASTPARSVITSWEPPPPPPAAPALSPGHIPDDWNPFADMSPASMSPPPPPPAHAGFGGMGAPTGGGGPLGIAMGPTATDSLDDLFGLGSAPIGGDPLGAKPDQALLLQPNMAGHADPLQALVRGPQVAPQSVANHGSELNAAMNLAPLQRTPSPPPPPPAPPPAPPVAQRAALPQGAVFSWDEPGAARPPPPVVAPRPAPPVQAATVPPVAMPPVASPTPPAAAQTGPGADALLSALLEGLAVPGLRIEALTPELMLLVGQLLRESTRGAVELLVARAALKREMRAQMTMIVGRENNPLKFSPSPEVALQHMLSPAMPGFMAPAPAMRDAFDDLRAHQIAVMAGMKAALDGVLKRFDPAQLEGQLTRQSAINSLIPATRKAKLWESFQELFAQLSTEAQDDFDELFGKAFLRAYEAQLDRLQSESPRG